MATNAILAEETPMKRTAQLENKASPEPEVRRWEAVLDRDSSLDGSFVFAVSTTGVFCRPSCPATRPPRARHRRLPPSPGQTEFAVRTLRHRRPLRRRIRLQQPPL